MNKISDLIPGYRKMLNILLISMKLKYTQKDLSCSDQFAVIVIETIC